jgi:hypothetical protein
MKRPPTSTQIAFEQQLLKNAPPLETRDTSLWSTLSNSDVEIGIKTLLPYITQARMTKFKKVLSYRTKNIRFVFENPANINNVWSCLRTFDTVGIQYCDIVMNEFDYYGTNKDNGTKGALRRKEMSAALGTQKYMSISQYTNIETCVNELKNQGYIIAVTDIHSKNSKALSNIIGDEDGKLFVPLNSNSNSSSNKHANKVVIIVGNEKVGASQIAKDLAGKFVWGGSKELAHH